MRLIDADALYERLKADEELARDRVIDTPNSFPNGMLNPAAVRYQAQLTERTRLKEIVYDAPTIEPEDKCGECDAWNQYKNYSRKSQWIPCGERLPKQGQEVICQCRANIIKVLKLDADGDWYQDAEHCYMYGFVIAWMPLPESYSGETKLRDYENKGDDD